MRIVVDVMGGDHGCGVIVEGVKLALNANEKITELYLVGDQTQIKPALTRSRTSSPMRSRSGAPPPSGTTYRTEPSWWSEASSTLSVNP